MTATTNPLAHIVFNEDGEALCGFIYQHAGKVPRAKRVGLMLTPESRRNQPEEGTYALARDGLKVSLDSAACGLHQKKLHSYSIGAEMVNDLNTSDASRLALLDYARRYYEARLDDQAAAWAEREHHWAEAKQAQHAGAVFTAREVPKGGDGQREWLIEGTYGDADEAKVYPMTTVNLTYDGGVPWVSTSDYMNSGPGRGNPSWTRVMIETLMLAEAAQAGKVVD